MQNKNLILSKKSKHRGKKRFSRFRQRGIMKINHLKKIILIRLKILTKKEEEKRFGLIESIKRKITLVMIKR